MHILNSSVA